MPTRSETPSLFARGACAFARQSSTLASWRFALAVRSWGPQLMRQACVPGVQVSWSMGSASVQTLCLGEARLGSHPMLPETTFALGSLSKPIASFAALVLVRDGVLSLDAAVGDELASAAPHAGLQHWSSRDRDGVTLRRLLSHTAGLQEINPPRSADMCGDYLTDSLVRQACEPGTQCVYSGAGYALVQRLIEHRTQQGFDVVARRCLFAPLSLASCGWERECANAPRALMQQSADYDGTPAQPLSLQPSVCSASSGLVATTGDICRMVHAVLWSNAILPAGLAQAAITPQPENCPAALFSCGLRLNTDPATNITTNSSLTHAGQRAGHRSMLIVVPQARAVCCMATNSTQGTAVLKPLTNLFRALTVGRRRGTRQ